MRLNFNLNRYIAQSDFYIVVFFALLVVALAGYVVNLNVQVEDRDVKGSQSNTYLVVDIVDGDTIKVSKDGVDEKVRLIGIDTPETQDPRVGVECFGKEAAEEVAVLLQNRSVYLEGDPTQDDKDRYGRLLRYVFRVDDNLLINRYLVANGFANEYTYRVPYKYQSEFQNAENSARLAKKGLWGDLCN